MLNQLVRYAPVLRMLRDEPGTILEIGSGSHGIAQFLGRRVIGLEIRFPEPPGAFLVPCVGTATAVPLANASVDAVLVMDTLEHIPPPHRPAAIAEAMRVARRRVIVGGPMGPRAREADERLAAAHRARGVTVPDWLAEHLIERAPDVADVVGPLRDAGWYVTARGNENLRAHAAMMRLEMHRGWFRLFTTLRRRAPRAVAAVARALRVPPYYSWLVDARRPATTASQTSSTRATSGPQS